MNRTCQLGAMLLGLCLAWTTPAHAHQVWLQSVQWPGKVVVHAGFGEPDHWDRRNVRKIDATKYYLRTVSGSESAIAVRYHERAECFMGEIAHNGPAAIVATCDYGVASHGPQPFLVTFFAKRLIGPTSHWAELDGSPRLPFELRATHDGAELHLVVTADGMPLANAEVMATGPGLEGVRRMADDKGRLSLPAAAAGEYAIFAMRSLPVSGERDGKTYAETKHVTTLSFHLPADDGPVAAGAADQAALSDMLAALKSQSLWGPEFPGFACDLEVAHQGLSSKGRLTIDREGRVNLALDDDHPVIRGNMTDLFESLAWHRAARNTGDQQTSRSPVEWAVARGESDAKGRNLIPLGDPWLSRFWIEDGRLRGAWRQMGDRRQCINILEAREAAEGRVIPTVLATSFWGLDGRLQKTETETRAWIELGGHQLPAALRIVSTEARGLTSPRFAAPGSDPMWQVTVITLSNHRLLEVEKTAAR